MRGIELAKQGKCEHCQQPVLHGPWTDEQIAEVIKDTGEPNFGDWCDDCFVRFVGCGDAAYTASMLDRPMQLSLNAGFSALLGVRP